MCNKLNRLNMEEKFIFFAAKKEFVRLGEWDGET